MGQKSKIIVYKATLIKRYKRFLADVILPDGTRTTIHVSNTGAMSGCAETDDTVWFSKSSNPKRKYPYSWELTEKPNGCLICVNTIRANEFIEQALLNNEIHQLSSFISLQREAKYGKENSRVDFRLTYKSSPDNFVEVKSATLLENQQGYFPSSKSVRGQKHLRELTQILKDGKKATLIFAILHSGIKSVKIAKHIDPIYNNFFKVAKETGVSIIQHKVDLLKHYKLENKPVLLRAL